MSKRPNFSTLMLWLGLVWGLILERDLGKLVSGYVLVFCV